MLLPQLHKPGLPAALVLGPTGGGLCSDRTRWRERRGKGWQGRSRLPRLQMSKHSVPLSQEDRSARETTIICRGHQSLACASHFLDCV